MTDNSSSAFENIANLRKLMVDYQLDAYIVPSADPHQTEYVHPHWRFRAWLSGFTGSAGTVVILADKAGLWTDGRYFIQAERELAGSGVDLFKMRMDGVPELIDWVCENLPENGRVGVDGRVVTAKQGNEWSEKLAKKNGELVIDVDLISSLWKDRPGLPLPPARLWPDEFAGRSVIDKLREIRQLMDDKEVDAYFIASLYDINWLLNIRGNDTAFTPLLTSFALVERNKATLFVDPVKMSAEILRCFSSDGISVMPYDGVVDALKGLRDSSAVYLCEDHVSVMLRKCIACKVVSGRELTALPKARKNCVELKNWERVHELDGVAMVRFWKWLEEQVPGGGVNENTASGKLNRIRLDNPECVDLSFSTISAYGPNAAMMHYSVCDDNPARLEPAGFYLVDSGGQYFGGTTDITRTFAMGELTDDQRSDYTLVLKGLISLSNARFLKGSCGFNLDILARRPLWESGLDYKCGTGHGVGCYLNVHEGPHSISQSGKSDVPLEPCMVVTIEPGVYKEDRYGIRIENMVAVENDCETECGVFYCFRTQTLCPIDLAPLKVDMLTADEIDWINSYHCNVFDRLSPHLPEDERVWLKEKTAPLELNKQ